MTYIENIYLCIALPVMLAVLCTNPRARVSMLFLLSGMTVCLFSSYISTFLASVMRTDLVTASVEITPLVEECMKLLPVLFSLLVFEPRKQTAANGILMTAVGFATFENICYLAANGAGNILNVLIRGAGAGAMHIFCGFLIGVGLLYLWDVLWLKVTGTISLLCLVITFHAIYNLLVTQTGALCLIGYVLPIVCLIPAIPVGWWLVRKDPSFHSY